MNRGRVALLYCVFAGLSIGVNIGTQIASITIYDGRFSIMLSMIAGTGTGLICKYLLDKMFIFRHRTANAAHEVRTFGLYALMGGLTTLLFWGTEYLFHFLFDSDAMRYIGGAIGLVIGYFVKYTLDRKFVFK